MKLEPHVIRAEPEEVGLMASSINLATANIADVFSADSRAVEITLEADEDSENGRSQWVWIVLANGDKALAVFPQGGTYFAVEEYLSADSEQALTRG